MTIMENPKSFSSRLRSSHRLIRLVEMTAGPARASKPRHGKALKTPRAR